MKNLYNKKLAAMMLLLVHGRRTRRTTLYKLLFFADLVHLLKFGWTISGSNYSWRQYGPIAEDVEVSRTTLVKAKFLKEERESVAGRYQYWYQVDEDRVDLDRVRRDLSADERDVLDRVRRWLAPRPAWYLSGRFHQFEPCVSTRAGALLDFSKAHKDERLIAWAKRLKLI